MEATIETSKSGTKVLIVPYQGDGFDEAIQAAEKRFDVTDDQTVTVIALPVSMTRGRRADICNPNYKKTEAEETREFSQIKKWGWYTMKKDLQNLKSPTVIKRSRVRREYTTAVRQESAKKAIGDLNPCCEIYGFTKGQWSIIDVIEHCLNQTGPAHVFISTWSAAGADIKAAQNFLNSGQILSLRFIVDYSFQSRKPEFCQELQAIFGADAIRVTVTHAKYVMIRNDKWNLVIRTSMNLNYNPRFENFEISDSKEFADFQQTIIDEIWVSQEAAEGFKQRPAENKKDFKRTFNEQTSIFNQPLTDARDLL